MPSESREFRQELNHLLAQYASHRQRIKIEKTALAAAAKHTQAVLEAQQLVQSVAEQIQNKCHQQIAALVTRCLRAVFGEKTYDFKVNFKRARGKTEAEFLLVRDGYELDPLEAAGGGVVDVVSFALRMACMLLSKPTVRKLLVMDEPFRYLSLVYREPMRQLVQMLAKELGIQFLIVSHSPEFRMGKIIEVE